MFPPARGGLLAVLVISCGWPSLVVRAADWTLLGTITEPAIVESSGLAASRRSAGVLWTVNDSGHDPVLYAIAEQGHLVGATVVSGAENVDWEDLALGPSVAAGTPDALYLADVGDNSLVRDEIVLYRVPEPEIGAAGSHPVEADRFAYTYPDGPHDAEALLVDPTGMEILVVTKEHPGPAKIYRLPWPASAATATVVELVGRLNLTGALSTRWPVSGMVTGGAVSLDRRRVMLRTPLTAYEWPLTDGVAIAVALRERPRLVALPPTPRGEAITYRPDGSALLLTSEGSPSPLFEVDVGATKGEDNSSMARGG